MGLAPRRANSRQPIVARGTARISTAA